MEDPREGQVFEGPEGPMIYVRFESGQYVFAYARERVVYLRKFDEVPPNYELVLDTRLAEERQELAVERGALIAALKEASSKLASRDAEEVRAIYRSRMAVLSV
jgi:hypothetical protein